MGILIINIKQIVQVERDEYTLRRSGREMSVFDTIDNGFIYIDGDTIRELGEMPDEASGGVKSLIERFGGVLEMLLMQQVNWYFLHTVTHIHIWYMPEAVRVSLLTKSEV
jgi:hypothetical protein